MKLIFLGTPAFAVPTLEHLVRTRHEIRAVITQPDRPRGRGMELAASDIKTIAVDYDLPLMQPEDASSPPILEKIRDLGAECAVVVAYGQILKRDFLGLSPLGCINLHPSLLPRHRGPTPIQSAILAGEQETGVTTILLDEGMDTGDILLQKSVDISADDTAGMLHDRLAKVGAELVIETLEAIENRSVTPRRQDETKATVTKKISKEDSIIDWNQSPDRVRDQIRAMDPVPGGQTTLGGKVLKIWRAQLWEKPVEETEPGRVLTVMPDSIIVRAGDGALRILEVQRAGKRRMSMAEFLRGQKIAEGTLLGI